MRRAALLVTLLALLVALAACGGSETEEAMPETVEGTVPTDTSGDGGGGAAEGDAEAGAEVYASAGCGSCHVYEPAGSSGTAGPSLDESDASYDEAYEQIANGGGGMPAFQDQLSEQEIADVAAFVTEGS